MEILEKMIRGTVKIKSDFIFTVALILFHTGYMHSKNNWVISKMNHFHYLSQDLLLITTHEYVFWLKKSKTKKFLLISAPTPPVISAQ